MNDDVVRETLRLYADEAPSSAGLLDAVRTRSRRRRRNQRFAAAGAVALAATLAIAGPAVVRAVNGPVAGVGTPVGTAPPTPPVATEPVETAPADPAALVPPTYDVGAFPFTPGWAPPDTSAPVVYTVAPNHLFLAHETPDGMYAIHVEVSPTDPDIRLYEEDPPPGEPATVLGRPGELRNDDDGGQPALVWQHHADLWVKVEGYTAEDVTRYAESLIEQPLPVRPPFTLDLVPAGAELGSVQPDAMRFVMRDEAACTALAEMDDEPIGVDLPVCVVGEFIVRLFRGGPGAEVPANFIPSDGSVITGDEPPLPRETIQVGDREAELIGDNNLHVFLDEGTALGVTALDELTLSREELVEVALGVQVMPSARSIFE